MGRFAKLVARAARLGLTAARRMAQLERRINRYRDRLTVVNRRIEFYERYDDLEMARRMAVEAAELQRDIDNSVTKLRRLDAGLPETP